VLQSQQVASSRLRAIETNRWVVQVAPTGFSAFVSPDGKVSARSGVSEQRVATHTVELREGRTPYNRLGDLPFVAAAVAGLFVLWGADRRAISAVEDRECAR
jgi:apolipoprotein N-acyltransferase